MYHDYSKIPKNKLNEKNTLCCMFSKSYFPLRVHVGMINTSIDSIIPCIQQLHNDKNHSNFDNFQESFKGSNFVV